MTLLRFATFLSPNLEKLYRSTAAYVGERLGCRTELVVGTSFEQITTGEVDLAFVCGYPYVKLAAGPRPPHALAAPVPKGDRYRGRPVYFSDVVVRRDDPVSSFAELRGCHWCFNERSSHSGYLTVLNHLVRLGESPAFFGRFDPVGFHLEAMRLVAEGAYEASAIDSHVLAVARRDDAGLVDRLKVVEAIGPSSIQPLVAGDHVPEALRLDVQGVVAGMHADPGAAAALDEALVERYEPVTEGFGDDIRSMIEGVERSGFLGA